MSPRGFPLLADRTGTQRARGRLISCRLGLPAAYVSSGRLIAALQGVDVPPGMDHVRGEHEAWVWEWPRVAPLYFGS